jgi:ketosteroid isomerase-like protein
MIQALLTALALLMVDAANDDREIAETYLAAYQAQDFETMHELYAEDAHFIDPTSFDMPNIGARIEWIGPDAIIAGLSGWGVTRIDYTIAQTYAASGRVVFQATADVVYGNGTDERVFRYPITTIITIVDGKVAEHRDYTDFTGMTELP